MAPHLSQLFQQPQRRSPRRPPKRSPRPPMGLFFMVYLGLVALMVSAPFSDALPTRRQTATLSPSNGSAVVEMRSRPVGGRVSGQVQAGDRGEVLDQHRGSDGHTWYFVRFASNGQRGWVRGDLLTLGNGTVAANPAQPVSSRSFPSTPAPQVVPQGLDNGGGTPVRTAVSSQNASTQEQIDYFLEVALGSEWGGGSGVIRKWTQDLRIQVVGSPTPEDLTTLQAVVSELNQLTNGQVALQFVRDNPNVQIYFVPEADFRRYEPNYVPRNLGFFWTRWNQSGIYNARILISTTGVTQTERSHLIREELTQAMGLMRDSYRYEDSIFQQRWTRVTAFSAIDRAVIQLLYRPEIRPGMTRSQVLGQLSR